MQSSYIERYQKIMALKEQGMTAQQISNATGYTLAQVYYTTQTKHGTTKATPKVVRNGYRDQLKRAAREFVQGTRCNSPHAAIKAGLRTETEWIDLVDKVRREYFHDFEDTSPLRSCY